ncbi:MAG: hypothetical protein QXI07_09615 [Pyrobaculum sp.]
MFELFQEAFERMARFVLAFNIVYAFATAAFASLGLMGDANAPLYAWARTAGQYGNFSVTSDTSALMNISILSILSFVSAFIVSLVLGLVQIVMTFGQLLGPLYAPALATAIVVQAMALFYVAVRVAQFIKSMISPLSVYT